MDDFPAGSASRGGRRPPLTVVIPVRDGGEDFGRCLRALRDQTVADFQVIVVDDGSVDGSAERAEASGAEVVRNPSPLGPAAARNLGAERAAAPRIFFLDADVLLHADAVERATRRFDADPGLSALFGSYDDRPPAGGVVSRFRNLLHHYVHQQGAFVDDARPAHTFWTGCGMIVRDDFLAIGGFDPRRYRRPAIEDIELGYRLSRAGRRIVLARDVQASHLKRWGLRQMVLTDIFQRGVPWMLLILRNGQGEADLNLDPSQRRSVAAVGLAAVGVILAPIAPASLALAVAGLAAQGYWNRRFYRFLADRRGVGFAAASFPLHTAYFCCCGVSVVLALAYWHRPRWWRRADAAAAAKKGRFDRADRSAAAGPSRRASGRRPTWRP